MRILDIGCGDGRLYEKAEGSYTGIDIDPEALERGKKKYPKAEFKLLHARKIETLGRCCYNKVISGVALCYVSRWGNLA